MNVQQVCKEAIQEIESSQACLLVDIESGRLLAFDKRSDASLSSDEVERLINLCSEMFSGRLIEQYAQAMGVVNGQPAGLVQEAQVASAFDVHFLAGVPSWGAAVLMLNTESGTNLGLGWAAIRRAREQLTQFQPDAVEAALASDVGDAWRRAFQTSPSGRAAAPSAPRPEPDPVMPTPNRAESDALSAPDALLRTERRAHAMAEASEIVDESGSNANFGARSQMYRPRRNDRKEKRKKKGRELFWRRRDADLST